MKVLLAFFTLLPGVWAVNAQTAVIRNVELAGDKIIVHYDLEDANPSNEYKLNLYASKDNFVAPLAKVSGDIGGEVTPGVNKKVVWSVLEELGGYRGRLALEIRGNVYSPFVKLRDFSVDQNYKRGKSYSLAWKPGATNPINIELYKGGERISGDMSQPNNGGHTFFIPARSKKGNDYRLKISDTRNPNDVLYTPNFKVRPKIPMLLKALPVVAAGTALIFLGGSSGGGNTPENGDSEIPGVPPLPGN
jgi:hypothetical protein